METENEFIKIEKDNFNVANSRFDFKKMNIDKIRERTNTLFGEIEKMKKTINFKVDNMFGKVETQYIELQKKKELTAQNKQKFEDTIVELDDLKNKEIQKTW
jgi:chromosome segregation ATPase